MSSRMQATALNNHAVSLMQRGSLWQALETCQSAIACLDDDQPLLNHCCCRFLAGPLNTYMCTCTLSILANRNRCMGETARQFLFEGNQSHVSGYEWVDCQPKEVHENASKIMKSTHSLIQAPEYNLTHDTRLAFLSLGAIKIFRDHTSEENLRHHVSCDCALRWAIYHNLGTINHILGLCMGELGHTLLHEAHHSYSLAQATIPTLAPFSDIIRLFLSNQNNQMVIYQEFAMHNESKACLQLLRDLLAVIPSFYSMGNSGLEPCDVLDHEILLNLMVMTRTVVAPAA